MKAEHSRAITPIPAISVTESCCCSSGAEPQVDPKGEAGSTEIMVTCRVNTLCLLGAS